jgi:hypothetical protein
VNAAGDLPAQVAAVGAFLDPAPLRSTVAEMEIAQGPRCSSSLSRVVSSCAYGLSEKGG